MSEYVSSYTGGKIDELLGFVEDNKNSPLPVEFGGTGADNAETALFNLGANDIIDGLRSDVEFQVEEINAKIEEINSQIDNIIVNTGAAINTVAKSTVPELTRHYKMNNSMDVPWDSGTLTCDMNEDGSVFRIQGNAYCTSANESWNRSEWIPGSNETFAGLKTFKVKAPSDGVIKWVDCCSLLVNVSGSITSGNFNYNHICIGTDGYVYICVRSASPNNTNPVMINFFGIVVSVDGSASPNEYILGSGE